ncbi:MAG: 1-acyl-sn-glycerol-3-phosphate acyltransferase [Gammaproteobacteria bacterium]|nr:1-acyl-sn-glycerol-3-phosphate acyltransferase [Gammaproteobacteria bacterium]
MQTETPTDIQTEAQTIDQFKDIRPYHDHEVRPVVDALLANPEFIRSIAGFSFPKLYRMLPGLVCWLTKSKLTAQVSTVNNVKTMQDIIAVYRDQMIEKTASKLTHSGIENLSHDKAYLFISNHRDIAMDPAFVNYMLYHAGFNTVQIAIGDNLLKRPFVTDLMRLNKSFIVRRSLKGRELLKSSKLLSEYIHHCIDKGWNVWIAQREGRAKDGVDRTDTALLKMLSMARRETGLKDSLSALHIVPVAISYEFDPCDTLKADELYQKKELGSYQKDERSDINSIVTGMIGFKGHVHVTFGKEIHLDSDDADAAAAKIDEQIIQNYLLQPTNFFALELLRKTEPELIPALELPAEIPADNDGSRAKFAERLAAADPKIRRWLLQMYANPVISRYSVGKDDPFAAQLDSDEQQVES